MKVNSTLLNGQAQPPIVGSAEVSLAHQRDFKSVLQSAFGEQSNRLQENLTQFDQRILQGDQISSRELLFYQVQAMRLGMRVELMSKVGESVLATARRLEQRG